MNDDGNAPTIPETAHPSAASIDRPAPRPPDDRYVLRTMLGKGGMGEVWLARDVRIDRDIAIKMMRSDGPRDPEAVARFLREARVQGRLEHPAIVPVHDLGGEQDEPYFAMKRLTGTTLADVLAARARGQGEERWSRRALLARLADICLAIELAHQRGVLHRDLKPANIMLGDFGETYVLDWGLARIADVAELGMIRTSDLRSGESGASGETRAGSVLGTPGYMAPEQMRGEAIDHRVDIFSLGCILFEILVGSPAVPREAAFEVTLAAPCYRPRERDPHADVAPELDDLCASATASDPARRPQTAQLLADGIQRFLDGDRDLARRRELAGEHVKRAMLALGSPRDEARAEAMREAGAAIALDPSNSEAKAILARMLLEPPAEVPPEARRRIELDQMRAGQRTLRGGAWAYFGFVLLVLALQFAGMHGEWPVFVLAGLLFALGGICFVHSRKPRPVSPLMFAAVLILHASMLAITGVLFGTLIVLPIFVIGSLANFITIPSVNAPKRITLAMSMAVVVPVALEWLDVLPRTLHVVGSAVVFEPWAVQLSPTVLLVGVITSFLLQVVVTASLSSVQRRSQERMAEQLHVQSWHLRHLVPDSAA
ncbi:MAG: Serine/threonine protein kinase PrkC, regulator of stationary phase [Myxococcales bacterium]|nr:Serine/threonine protein kinase PrkC, regulator of stationary phase [Myxococcales bacterium]